MNALNVKAREKLSSLACRHALFVEACRSFFDQCNTRIRDEYADSRAQSFQSQARHVQGEENAALPR